MTKKSPPDDLNKLADKLGYCFRDGALLLQAVTHPSMAGGSGPGGSSAYERLEFLGDRVLGLVIAQWLYAKYPKADEGELAKRHASLVNRDALKEVAMALGLDAHLRLARDEEAHAPRKNQAAVSDAMEGVIGALYLDGGLPPVEQFIHRYWQALMQVEAMPADPKTALQEYAQARGQALPVYKVLSHSGPAHAPKFVIEVRLASHPPVSAEGGSKREAEKLAAQMLLAQIGKA